MTSGIDLARMMGYVAQITGSGVASWLVQVVILSQLEIRLQDNHSSAEEANK